MRIKRPTITYYDMFKKMRTEQATDHCEAQQTTDANVNVAKLPYSCHI